MSSVDPLDESDRLIDAIAAGESVDDPALGALATLRAVALAEIDDAPLHTPVAVAARGGDVASLFGRRTGAHRRSAAVRTRRAAFVAAGAASVLGMGVSQAVAGNPVAPIQYVVETAVGIGEDVASPNAARPGQVPPGTTGPEVPPQIDANRGAAAELPTSERAASVRAPSDGDGDGDRSDRPARPATPVSSTSPDRGPREVVAAEPPAPVSDRGDKPGRPQDTIAAAPERPDRPGGTPSRPAGTTDRPDVTPDRPDSVEDWWKDQVSEWEQNGWTPPWAEGSWPRERDDRSAGEDRGRDDRSDDEDHGRADPSSDEGHDGTNSPSDEDRDRTDRSGRDQR